MSLIIFEYSTWITYGDLRRRIQFHNERRNERVSNDRLDTDNEHEENDPSNGRKWTSMVVITSDEKTRDLEEKKHPLDALLAIEIC